MEERVSRTPCFKFEIAGMRLSLSCGVSIAGIAFTFYIQRLHVIPALFCRSIVPNCARRSTRQAIILTRLMIWTQSHARLHWGACPKAGRRNAPVAVGRTFRLPGVLPAGSVVRVFPVAKAAGETSNGVGQ